MKQNKFYLSVATVAICILQQNSLHSHTCNHNYIVEHFASPYIEGIYYEQNGRRSVNLIAHRIVTGTPHRIVIDSVGRANLVVELSGNKFIQAEVRDICRFSQIQVVHRDGRITVQIR